MVAIDINGTIEVRDKIPSVWNGVINYNSLNNSDQQLADGWRTILVPSYDKLTQKLGDLYLSEPNYTYQIINLTQEEIDIIKNNNQEDDADNSFYNNIESGNQLFSKSYRRMYRRYKDDDVAPNNVLVLDDVKKYMAWNKDCYTSLNQGDYYSAEAFVLATLSDNSAELANNNALRKMFEWLRDQIQDYILNTYDL